MRRKHSQKENTEHLILAHLSTELNSYVQAPQVVQDLFFLKITEIKEEQLLVKASPQCFAIERAELQ